METVVVNYFFVQNNLKLFHFATPLYAHHKIADKLRESLTDTFDTLAESYQGIYGRFILNTPMDIPVKTPNAEEMREITLTYRKILLQFRKQLEANPQSVDLLSLIDSMLENINKFNYLLTFE